MMNSDRRRISRMLLCSVAMAASPLAAQNLPMPPREFRAAWVATVANIDWPSSASLSVENQTAELKRIVDRAAELNLNALIFQVRPACDALYASELEPWSPYLCGEMGAGPQPAYDPLAMIVQLAKARGIEVHAWFNPYRALHKSFQGEVSADHISNVMPDAVKGYDGYLWLDPGNPRALDHTINVISDVVRRYDIDGVHLDDYFYPYPVKDDEGELIPFPDDETFDEHGKRQDRDDWRRENVNRLIERLYRTVKQIKQHVKVGVSPFGIWRPGHPESIKGFDAYAAIYADSRLWLREGWVDYLTPQLYWSIDSEGQSYPVLLDWWLRENRRDRRIWPGNYASKIGFEGERRWQASEVLNQIEVTRRAAGADGNVMFSMKALFDEYGELGQALLDGPYREPAVVPQTGELPEDQLSVYRQRPQLQREDGQLRLSAQGDSPKLWVVWTESNRKWSYEILPAAESVTVRSGDGKQVAISWVTRTGHMTEPQYYNVP